MSIDLANLTREELLKLPKEKLLAIAMLKRKGGLPAQRRSFERYQDDPVAFAREQLGVDLWERQEAILRSVAANRRTTVRSCHHSGKTFSAALLAHWWTRCFEPSLVITTAPTERQVKDVLWHEIQARQHAAKLSGTMNAMSLTVSPSQRALGFTTREPERFQGWHSPSILVIVDEASGVDEPIYEAIEGILTGPHAHLLLIGNPNSAMGTFYDSFTSDRYQQFHVSAHDVPERLLPPGWKEEMRLAWGEDSPMYQVRVLGEFPPQGEDSLLSLAWVTAAQERENESLEMGLREEEEPPAIIGCDIARYGSDESVAYCRRGASVVAADYWRGADTLQSAGRIAALARRCDARRIHVDDIGVGGGVTDQLRRTFSGSDVGVIGVNVGEAARDSESYFNLRSELFAGLAERFKTGDISIPESDTILAAQLVVLKKQYTPRGQMKLMSKEDMRKERIHAPSWKSPDRADALMLAFAVVGRHPGGMTAVSDAREEPALQSVMGRPASGVGALGALGRKIGPW